MLRYNVFQNIIKRLSFILVIVGTILPTSWTVMADCCDTCAGTGCFDAPNPLPCLSGQYQVDNCCCYGSSTIKEQKLQNKTPIKDTK